MRSSIKAATFLVSGLLLVSCSDHGGETPFHHEEGGQTPGPVTPAISLDLDVGQLTQAGCLNLPEAVARLKAMSSAGVMRRYTSALEIEPVSGKKSDLRRNFVAEVAFGRFLFEEKAIELGTEAFPLAQQIGCGSLEVTHEVSGIQKFSVRESANKNELHLIDEGGQETVYRLKGPREMEIEKIDISIDRCPYYPQAKTKTIESIQWGSQSEIDHSLIKISRSYLQKISDAVDEMPGDLMGLVTHASSDIVSASSADLRGLSASRLDEQVQNCPYRPDPPDGTEPAPPENTDPQPTPTPADTAPTPTPTPEPTPMPQPTPEPDPVLPWPLG